VLGLEARAQAGRQRRTEVDVRDGVVEHEVANETGDLHLAVEQDVCAIHDVEGLLDVVVGDQHADAAVLEAGDDLLNVVHRDRIDARERLVEHHELRLRDERARDLEAPALTAGKRERLVRPQVLDVQLVEEPFEPQFPLLPADGECLEDREDVLLDRELAEHGRFLREIADAPPRAAVHRHVGDVFLVEEDPAVLRRDEADDHVERRRLAGAVRAEEADDLSLLHVERDVVHHIAAAIRLHESFGAQDAVPLDSRRYREAARRGRELTRLAQGGTELAAQATDLAPKLGRHPQLGVRGIAVHGDERATAHQARDHDVREVEAHFVEAEPSGLGVGVASLRAHGSQVVRAQSERDLVERRGTVVVRETDECEQRERRGPVFASVPLGDRVDRVDCPGVSVADHGFFFSAGFCAGLVAGLVAVESFAAADLVLSATSST